MAVILPHETAAYQFAQHLGVDPTRCKELKILFLPDDVITIEAKLIAHDDDLVFVQEKFKNYKKVATAWKLVPLTPEEKEAQNGSESNSNRG